MTIKALALCIELAKASAAMTLRVCFSLFPILPFLLPYRTVFQEHSSINILYASISLESISREFILKQYAWKIVISNLPAVIL